MNTHWPWAAAVFSLLTLALLAAAPGEAQHRPKITGISGVAIRVSAFCPASDFYSEVLGSRPNCPPGNSQAQPAGGGLALGSGQSITLNTRSLNGSSVEPSRSLLEKVSFYTDDPRVLRQYLQSRNLAVGEIGGQKPSFTVRDPQGLLIEFIEGQPYSPEARTAVPPARQRRIIHAGFIVRDQAAMDHFYKEILGFRPYWFGGMKDDRADWVSLQVPEGTDWIEFMLNLPADADQHLRGVMNHIALGVPDIQQAREQLVENGVHLTEEPKMGRDGKWQLNLYDPDQTRVEFMEFTPKEKPCCSEFTGPHPKP
jgi:catechol 2,3-dioxygenase-like lactoylglutathione lyase family enzyme